MLNVPEEIKTLFKSDSSYKNFRVHFPNGERADITNDNIVSESVSFTESICSEESLKFGVSEAPTIRFETVGVENIKRCVIQCSIEIECPQSIQGSVYRSDIQKTIYPIKYGTFVVQSCKRQKDMSHRIIEAYQGVSLDGWSFPERMKSTLAYFEWYKANGFKLSIECLLKSLSGYDRNFVQMEPSFTEEVTFYTYNVRIGSQDFKFSVKGVVNEYSVFTFGDHLHIVKPYFESGYQAKLDTLINVFLEYSGLTDRSILENVTYSECKCNLNGLSYTKDLSPVSGTYGYVDNMGTVDYTRKLFSTTTEEVFLPEISMEEEATDGTYWIAELGAREIPDYSGRIVYTNFFNVPTRLKLYNYDTQLFDTGSFANGLLKDSNEVSITQSDMGLYFYPGFKSKKQKFKQVKNGVESTVKKTVYVPTFDQLDSLNLLKFIESSLEVKGCFGRFTRDGAFTSLSLANTGTQNVLKSEYSELWYDEEYTKKIGRINCNFMDEDNEDDTVTLDLVDNFDPLRNKEYNISKNYMLDLNPHSSEDISDMLDEMEGNVEDIEYIPTEITTIGMPWVEAGDYINVETEHDGIIKVLVEERTLSGIQRLTDDITCRDDAMETTSLAYTYNPDTETLIIEG